jgi:Uma2 family endonuclease
MALVSLGPCQFKRLLRHRRRCGGDRYDEVWDGVYVMAPLADNEHQSVGFKLAVTFADALGPAEKIQIFPGCNVSDQPERWRRNYRCPDVAVFLPGNPAIDRKTYWFGGPDFAVEVMSRFDRARKKFDFYKKVGVRELLLVDRHPWSIEFHRAETAGWLLVGRCDLKDRSEAIPSEVLGLTFRLVAGASRPQIEVVKTDTGKEWLV